MKPMEHLCTFLALLLAACTTETAQVRDRTLLASLGFIESAGPSREQVVARLGEPARSFENGRIAIYRVHPKEDRLTTYGWGPFDEAYDLVLVYGQDGRLERHSLVGRHE